MPPTDDRSDRPKLAIIARALTPYRLRLHTRIAREIPEVELASLVLHRTSNQPWSFQAPAAINLHWMSDSAGTPPTKSRHRPASPAAIRAGWRLAGQVIKWLIEHRPSVVVLTGYSDISRVRILRWCRKHGVPVYMFSDSNASSDRSASRGGMSAFVKRCYVRWILNQLSGLLVCGRGGVEYYRPYGGKSKPFFYVPHEGDYELIESIGPDDLRKVREQFDLRPDRRYIIYCGRLVNVKRVDVLISAFTRIAAERADWDLLIVGDGPLREKLRKSVPDELDRRVIFTGFVNDRNTINAIYRASDVFVLPSDYEPWGTVVSEACAAGLAVIASDAVGAAYELVVDGVNGRTVQRGNVDELAVALREITSEDRIESLKAASHQVLADWRDRGDPIDGIRAMLCHAGVLDRSAASCRQPIDGIRL